MSCRIRLKRLVGLETMVVQRGIDKLLEDNNFVRVTLFSCFLIQAELQELQKTTLA